MKGEIVKVPYIQFSLPASMSLSAGPKSDDPHYLYNIFIYLYNFNLSIKYFISIIYKFAYAVGYDNDISSYILPRYKI